MKKEERLLDALGDVKSSYILECSQYVGNNQKEVLLLRPQKPRWAHFSAVAAAMALFITATLLLLPKAREARQAEAASSVIQLGDGTQLKIVPQLGEEAEGFSPIDRIEIYRDEALLQTIDESTLPDPAANYYNEGLYLGQADGLGQPDYRDVNFDGYTDIGFPSQGRATDNLPYHYFLWNNAAGQFDYGFILFGGAALEVDEEARQLIETVSTGSGLIERYYRFTDGLLQQIDVGQSTDNHPDFQISYDETQLAMTSGEGGLFISPLQGVGSYTPVCEIQIELLPGVLPTAAADEAQAGLRGLNVGTVRRSKDWDQTILHVQYGTQWDAMVEDIHFISAGVRGTYKVTSRYYVEAAEGYGVTFAQICQSFTCLLPESANPEAERAAIAFADGFFSGDWTDMEPYLNDPNGEISREDIYTGSEDIKMVELRGLDTLDEQIRQKGTGSLSLLFRAGGEDSRTSLSMDMIKAESGYKVSFYGLEK